MNVVPRPPALDIQAPELPRPTMKTLYCSEICPLPPGFECVVSNDPVRVLSHLLKQGRDVYVPADSPFKFLPRYCIDSQQYFERPHPIQVFLVTGPHPKLDSFNTYDSHRHGVWTCESAQAALVLGAANKSAVVLRGRSLNRVLQSHDPLREVARKAIKRLQKSQRLLRAFQTLSLCASTLLPILLALS